MESCVLSVHPYIYRYITTTVPISIVYARCRTAVDGERKGRKARLLIKWNSYLCLPLLVFTNSLDDALLIYLSCIRIGNHWLIRWNKLSLMYWRDCQVNSSYLIWIKCVSRVLIVDSLDEETWLQLTCKLLILSRTLLILYWVQ